MGPFHPTIKLNSNLFAVNLDGRFLYAGGLWDNSLRIYSVTRAKPLASIIRHLGVFLNWIILKMLFNCVFNFSDIITCLSLDNCGSYLITGSRDCTSIIWAINQSAGITTSSATTKTVALNQSLVPTPIQTLYGHNKTITCVAILTELNVAASGSLDGVVNIYSIVEGQYIRTLEPLGCVGIQIEISFIDISPLQGQIAFSASDDKSHSVHVFSM